MGVKTKYPKERIKVKVTITNAMDGITQDYYVSLEFRDANGKLYHFIQDAILGFECHGHIKTRNEYDEIKKIKQRITAGTSVLINFIAYTPEGTGEFAEGKIEGKVTVYESDAADAGAIITTDWIHAYNYSKKKYNMSMSVIWE